ncbi:MAG: hypothetical protein ACFFCW_18020 [Candidatus Hodarchaeota archaeon]
MSDIITEALLEMHFHRAIIQHFESIYGANFLRLLKPSSQQEAWVGFDQGWIHTTLSNQELFDELRQAVQSANISVKDFYLGYFLQFKIVERILRRSRFMPISYTLPYLRAELSLEPNTRTGLSQHETLLRLSQINNAAVCYACPMFFESDDIYANPDLDRLRCVDMSSAPSGWATNQRHFAMFQHEFDPTPLWCSEPSRGKALSFKQWASPDVGIGPRKLSGQETMDLIKTAVNTVKPTIRELQQQLFPTETDMVTRVLPESFTILKFGSKVRQRETKSANGG